MRRLIALCFVLGIGIATTPLASSATPHVQRVAQVCTTCPCC